MKPWVQIQCQTEVSLRFQCAPQSKKGHRAASNGPGMARRQFNRAIKVGQREEMAGKNIVVIIPSFAERYLSTALFEGLIDEDEPTEPKKGAPSI